MPFMMFATLAFVAAQSVTPPGTPPVSDLTGQQPLSGSWSYSTDSQGRSSARFDTANGTAELTIRCTRSTRRIAILKPASGPSQSLWIWTSARSVTLPATWDASTKQIQVELGAYDPILDAIASSLGRIGFSSSGLAALVVPPWAEVARVVEDCRV